MALKWTESLSVGYAAIDAQHRELVGRFNDLLEACRKGQGKEKVAALFGFLDDYVVAHFGAEERLMAEHGYPATAEHKSQHAYFVGKLAELKAALREGGASFALVIDTNQILFDWIIEHIRNVDVQLGAYLRARSTGAG
jgi:hemerythrin